MNLADSAGARRDLADRLAKAGVLNDPALRRAVEEVPREAFLHPGVFLPGDDNRWIPKTAVGTGPQEWLDIAYSDQSLVTQLDGHLTADQTSEPVTGFPTSSSTLPETVLGMIQHLDLGDGNTVLELGTGTGYSSALMCHRLGADNVATVEVDLDVARRADAALEACGYSAWTVHGDGLTGYPRLAPYDRVIATMAVRRIPYGWVRQTRPGGTILATIGTWTYGTGLAKLTVREDGTAHGRIVARSSFMAARSQVDQYPAGDLAARAAYATSERITRMSPQLLDGWTPAFFAQLAAPGVQLIRSLDDDGSSRTYLFDVDRESFAELTEASVEGEWNVRQGGPLGLWDRIEETLALWQANGEPGIEDVRLAVDERGHTYWIGEEKPDGPNGPVWTHRV